jgi:hypothetical protein
MRRCGKEGAWVEAPGSNCASADAVRPVPLPDLGEAPHGSGRQSLQTLICHTVANIVRAQPDRWFPRMMTAMSTGNGRS